MKTLAPLQGLDRFSSRITAALRQELGIAPETIHLERPPSQDQGEFAFPCFRLAKERSENPARLARELSGSLSIPDVKVSAAGPFLNFQIDRAPMACAVLADALRGDFGAARQDLSVVVEFSSPNIAKPMHAGHLRSTVSGAALARIFTHLGNRVVRVNHVGDWGSQFGKLIAAWNRWGDETALGRDPIGHLLALYVRFHKEEEADPALAAEARSAFQDLESGRENETRAVWQRFTRLSLGEFQKVYERLGIEFDHIRGESWYESRLGPTLAWLESRGVVETSEGARIVDLTEQGLQTPGLVQKTDGTTLYLTRDLAAALSRWEEFHFDHCLYVVGNEQKLHFQQIKAVLERCGCSWAGRIEHIPFGLIRLAEGKLSTRQGRVLLLSEVLDRAVELAARIVAEKNPDHPDPARVAREVGIGAVVFHDLKNQRTKDVVFDWKEVLSFEGDAGPSLQYTHARCCAILRKAGRPVPSAEEVDAALLADSPALMAALGRFPAAVREAAARREPSVLAQYLLRLGTAGNHFYRDHRVLGSEAPLEAARLAAIEALRRTLATGLGLLGVPAPEAM